MPEKLLKLGFKSSFYQYIGTIAVAFLGFVTSIYLIKGLSVEDYGVYSFLFNLVILAQLMTSLGLPSIIQRYLPSYRNSSDLYMQKRLISFSVLVRLCAGVIFVAILWIFRNGFSAIFKIPIHQELFLSITCIIILFSIESQLLGESVLTAMLEIKFFNLASISYAGLRFLFIFYCMHNGYGLAGVVYSWLLVEIILCLVYFIKTHSLIFSVTKGDNEAKQFPLRKFFSFGGNLYLHNLTYFFRDKAGDIFLLAYFSGPYAVGLYSFTFGIPLALTRLFPGNVLKGVMTSIVVNRYTAVENKKELSFYFSFFNKFIFFITIPIFLFIIILSDKIILHVFNPAYIANRNLFVISMCFVMMHQFLHPYSAILIAMEKSRLILYSSMIAFLNLAGDILLIPVYGVLGAILATGFSGIVFVVYFYVTMRRNLCLVYPWKSFIKWCINATLPAAAIFLLRPFCDSILSILLTMAFGVLVYMVFSCLNRGFESRDRKVINESIGKALWIF